MERNLKTTKEEQKKYQLQYESKKKEIIQIKQTLTIQINNLSHEVDTLKNENSIIKQELLNINNIRQEELNEREELRISLENTEKQLFSIKREYQTKIDEVSEKKYESS